MVNIGNDWDQVLTEEFQKEYYQQLRQFLVEEYRTHVVYPDMHDIFTDALLYGYGVYSPIARKKHNEETGADTYVVSYTTGTSCD